ncbi:hypothetical protein [Pseudarthrobacter sp. Y6]|uniref:hypothetical protein n=1 Tax=Pseudarthrobacter sp. Y6 TaxID=3418422 RepID=UPI003CEC01B4
MGKRVGLPFGIEFFRQALSHGDVPVVKPPFNNIQMSAMDRREVREIFECLTPSFGSFCPYDAGFFDSRASLLCRFSLLFRFDDGMVRVLEYPA